MTPYRRILDEKRRLIWPLVAGLVLNIALFALVVYPLSQKVGAGEQDAKVAADTLAAAKARYNDARQTVTGKSQADKELQRFYGEVLPPDLSGARRITYLRIQQLARQNDLRFDTQTATPSRLRESDLGRLTQTAVLAGEYGDIRRFIYQLETAPEFLVIERVDLAQPEQERTGAITVTMQVATYFWTGADGN